MNFLPLSIILFLTLGFGQLADSRFNKKLLTSGSLTYAQLRHGCGRSPVSQSRIEGGKDAKAGEWPWIAKIIIEFSNGITGPCGGSLINNRCILTAAHCLMYYNQTTKTLFNPAKITVKLGHLDDLSKDNANARTYTSLHWTVHENYNWTKHNQLHDIALIKLDEPVIFSNWIRPICLPEPSDPNNSGYVGRIATVIGWGCLTFGGNYSSRLREVDVKIISHSTCKKYYKYLTYDQICAGDEKGEKDSCRGDSGGPLMIASNGQFNVIGTVAYGKRAADSKSPGVYINVGLYITWIKKHCGMMN